MFQPNTLIAGRYRIVRKIGQGGMGAVYEAVDERLGRQVALKQTLVTDDALKRAFEREARLLANLNHPNLPRVTDHFIDAEGQFLVMDYIPGKDLFETLKDRGIPFAVEMVLRWADQLLDVLDYLHSHTPPIIHRDIKPQNAKVTTGNRLMLLDFGLAKGSPVQTRATSGSSIVAYTPSYAALEQIHGSGTDERSDLYSLGATLYNLLTNQTPIDALTRSAAMINQDTEPQPAAHTVNPQVPPAISAVIMQAMAMPARDRPASAAVMRQQLQATASQGAATGRTISISNPPPAPVEPRSLATRKKQPWFWLVLLVLAVVAMAGIVGMLTTMSGMPTAVVPTATPTPIPELPTAIPVLPIAVPTALTATPTLPTVTTTPEPENPTPTETPDINVGLLAYYPCNGNINDASGNGRDGTPYAVTFTTDRLGMEVRACSFNGYNSYVQTPIDSNRKPLSFSVWFQATDVAGERSIVDSDVYGDSGHSLIIGYWNGDGTLDVEYHNQAGEEGNSLETGLSISKGDWYHVVVNYAEQIEVYVNGGLIAQREYLQTSFDGTTFRLGRHNNQAPKFFQGMIDDVRFYDRSLSASEVIFLYQEAGR